MSGIQYSLTFINYSAEYGSVCVYQNTNNGMGIVPLAWMVRPTHPTTVVTFKWTTDYGFVWSETGELAPEVIFSTSQVWPADLVQNNAVTLSFLQGAYTFQNLTKGSQEGVLEIYQDASIPPNSVSVGIAMAGSGIFARQAVPNIKISIKPQNPEYWIAFGNFKQGEALDISAITNKQKLEFESGVFSLCATLYRNNSWFIG